MFCFDLLCFPSPFYYSCSFLWLFFHIIKFINYFLPNVLSLPKPFSKFYFKYNTCFSVEIFCLLICPAYILKLINDTFIVRLFYNMMRMFLYSALGIVFWEFLWIFASLFLWNGHIFLTLYATLTVIYTRPIMFLRCVFSGFCYISLRNISSCFNRQFIWFDSRYCFPEVSVLL